jgi:excisionase family DNA binding protein
MPVQAMSPLFKLTEAAEYLGLSAESVRKYVQRDRLKPNATIGNAYLFTKQECDRFKKTIRPVGNPNFVRKKRAKNNS